MAPSTISVALCTFNGASFLARQLESITAQTRLPDELVVCDDCSTDETVGIVEAFEAIASFPVRLYRNDHNLGYAKNFEQAIRLCTGDLIALCDQDDLWRPDKLARTETVLAAHPLAGLVCSDAEVVDRDLQPLDLRLTASIGLTKHERELIVRGQALAVLLHRNFAMGAASMVRSACLGEVLPIPPGWPHDWWIALIASLRHQVFLLDETLLLYRQHGGNAIGIPEPPSQTVGDLIRGSVHPRSAQFVRQAQQWEAALDRIGHVSASGPTNISERELADLRARVRHLWSRARLPHRRLARVPVIVREVVNLGYHRYSAGIASAAKDIYVTLATSASRAKTNEPAS